jgi:hypothetical protein
MTVRAFFLVLVLTGCAHFSIVSMEANYITFEHAFTDEAAAQVRSRAEGICKQRKREAIKTQSACSLTKCVTSYQCVAKADAAAQ